MKTIPINQRDSWSPLPNEEFKKRLSDLQKPKNEPQPNAFSAKSYEWKEEVVSEDSTKKLYRDGVFIGDIETEDPKAILNGYYTLIIFVTSGMIIGAILATITMFAIYATAIERGNLMYETDDLIKLAKYNTDIIRDKVEHNEQIANKINENIEKIGNGIVQELKPKEAKIVNQ